MLYVTLGQGIPNDQALVKHGGWMLALLLFLLACLTAQVLGIRPTLRIEMFILWLNCLRKPKLRVYLSQSS